MCGLAVFSALRSDRKERALVKRLSVEYRKKARGQVTATCSTGKRPTASGPWVVETVMTDASGEVVAVLTVDWVVELRSS